ncbi:transcriptional regulator [Amycolatopsis keratiniphila subsp. keratiniphila]|uniref:Transcriptional regulator n=1 Tax=Amycolatopsis keratiniphila subsp. keratiniphila TaxID=227715 RepID=A0A1W2LV18_9PSEU|nr:transcriptional regulator [Amycolatopsis keratiniphila subsp. keratiniphila]
MTAAGFPSSEFARLRFAFSPASEAITSLRLLQDPGRCCANSTCACFFALVPLGAYFAEFLTPPPASPVPDLDAELDRIARADLDEAVAEASPVPAAESDVVQRFLADPAAGVARAADELRLYWDTALARFWPQIRGLFEAEIVRRSRQLARDGAGALFNDLHPNISWDDGRLKVRTRAWKRRGPLGVDGLILIPSVFHWPDTAVMAEPYQPILVYPAPGVATVWAHDIIPTTGALDALIGRTRARVLVALSESVTTTALGRRLSMAPRRLSMAPGAVSQHLKVLHDNGLITRHRSGREVFSARSALGDTLCANGSALS